MAFEQKLSISQSQKLVQKLVMTPSLQQAIKLLQMTRLELEGVLAQELVENPILEEGQDGLPESEAAAEETPEKAEDNNLSEVDLDAFFGDEMDPWDGGGYSGSSMREEGQGPPLENTLTREPDLYDHLLWQLHMMEVSDEILEIAELIIGNLDPDGFLEDGVDEIRAMGAESPFAVDFSSEEVRETAEALGLAAPRASDGAEKGAEEKGGEEKGDEENRSLSTDPISFDPIAEMEPELLSELLSELTLEQLFAQGFTPPTRGYSKESVEEALRVVRSLDPPGVACRDLRECLLAQLDVLGEPEDSLTRRAVAETWDLFKMRKLDAAARRLGVPLKDLEQVVETLRTLETRPGRRFNNDKTQYVEPDVHVVKVADEYVIQLNDDGMPRLRVSRAYRKMLRNLSREGSQSDAQQYIREKMRSAVWLIKSLDQRQRTIYKVAKSIVRQQRAFLDHGIDHLRPMVLRDVAEDIEMHESTVSRVVSNKYIHTPRGLFPMKFFFHSGIDREYGGDISSLSVKRKIQHLIQEEDSKKPLSDSALAKALKREGIQIARRTVAKYRDELSIPSSTERKQLF